MAFLRTKNFAGQTFQGELAIDGANDPTWNDCEVIGGTFLNAIYVTRVSNLRINGADITAPNGIGIYVEQTGSQDVELTNNVIHDCGKEGIYVNEGTATSAPRHVNMRITNNRILNCAKGATGDTASERHGIECYAKDYLIEGNQIDTTLRGHAIRVHSTGVVRNNICRNTGRNGIAVFCDRTPGGQAQVYVGFNTISNTGTRADSAAYGGISVYNGPYNAQVEIVGNTINTAPKATTFVEAPATAYIHDNILDGVGSLPGSGGGGSSPVLTGALGEPEYTAGTVVIMQADGAPGSSTLSDGDGKRRGKPVKLVGGAKLVAYGAAGQRAIRLDGLLTSYVEVEHAELAADTLDFSVEVMWRPDAVIGGAMLFDTREDNAQGGYAVGVTATHLSVLAGPTEIMSGPHSGLSKVMYSALARIGGTARMYSGLKSASEAAIITAKLSQIQCTKGRIRIGAGIRGLIIGIRVSKRTGRQMIGAVVPVPKTFPPA